MSNNDKTKTRQVAYDYIRVVAMMLIVFCHFFQIINCINLAFWLNIGVQIFFVLSAKLLGSKKFENWKDVCFFYKTRFLKIMLPVWIYLALICLALCIIGRPPMLSSLIVYALGGAAFIKTGVLGLGHFWYISIILIAYLILPFLALFSNKIKKMKTALFVSVVLLLFILLVSIFYLLGNASYGVHLTLFIFAYYFFQREDKENWDISGTKKCLSQPF